MKEREGHSLLFFVLACAIPAVGYTAFLWGAYADMRDKLLAPGDKICSGEAACIQAITSEHRLDFALGVLIGAPVIFMVTFVAAIVFVVVIDRLRWRVRYARTNARD